MTSRDELIQSLFADTGVEEEIELPAKVRIGEGALEKAYMVCDLVRHVHRRPGEWYGFMVAPKSEPEVVRDILIGYQRSTTGHTKIEGDAIGRAVEVLKKAKGGEWVINGWIHSHGGTGVFFSGMDDNNNWDVLNSVYHNTAKIHQMPYRLIEGRRTIGYDRGTGLLKISGTFDTDPVIEIPLGAASKSERRHLRRALEKIKVSQAVKAGWSYAIVVNDKSENKGHINYTEERLMEGKRELTHSDADVEIVEGAEYKLNTNKNALKREVEAKIRDPYAGPVTKFVRKFKRKYVYTPQIWTPWFPQTSESAQASTQRVNIPINYTPYELASLGGSSPIPEFAVVRPSTSQPAQPVQQRDYTAEEFLHAAIKFLPRLYALSEIGSLYAMLNAAARAGSENISGDYRKWIEGRLEVEQIPGTDTYDRTVDRLRGSIYKMFIDPAMIAALDSYAQADPDFQKFMNDFTEPRWIGATKGQIVFRYSQMKRNKGSESGE